MNNTIPQAYNKSTLLKEFECLDNYQDVYSLINVHDSLVRERLFNKLADIIRVNYNYIYNQWLKSSN